MDKKYLEPKGISLDGIIEMTRQSIDRIMKFKAFQFVFALAVSFSIISCSNQTSQAQSTTDQDERQGPPPNGEKGPPPQRDGENAGQRPQGGPPTFAKLLKDLDANEDGKLSQEEARGPLKDDFAKIDTNEDGYINETEFKSGAPKPPRRE